MTRKQQLEKRISELREEYRSDHDFILSGYPDEFDQLSEKEFSKLMSYVGPDYTDVDVSLKRKNYVVEITCVDNEVGFSWLTRDEYINRYGNERYEKD